MSIDKNIHIGIIGTGAIAYGFAVLFTGNGYKTTVIARSEASANKLLQAYNRFFDTLEERKLVTTVQRKNCAALLSLVTRWEDFGGVEIIFEAIYEDLDIKFEAYKKIEEYCPKVKAIGSATSALASDDLKKGFKKYRKLFAVAHPYNPPQLVPLVELVASDESSSEALQLLKDFLESCGRKVCFMKKSVPGFIANRLQHAMLREALHLVETGVATAADVDMAITNSFAPRYTKVGLIQHNDGYGLDMLEKLQNYLYPDLCNDKGANPLVVRAVKQGNLGQKTGRGILEWNEHSIAEFRRNATEPFWQFFNWNLP